MSDLLKAEMLRLSSRRLLVVLLVAIVALAAFGALVGADSVRPPSAQEIASADEAFQDHLKDWQETCGGDTAATDCEGWDRPEPDTFDWRNLGFGEYAEGALDFGFPLMLLAVAALVASLVGAEFATGNIGTQLLFTPRRIPVMTAKLTAGAVAGVLVAAIFVGASLALSAITFLALRGAHDMSAGVGLPLLGGRIMVLALLLAVMSGALAMGLGSTLTAMGGFAVVGVGSFMLSSGIRGGSRLQLFLPSNVLIAMMDGTYESFDWLAAEEGMLRPDGSLIPSLIISYDWALGYSVIGTVLIVAVAAWHFRRRDILH